MYSSQCRHLGPCSTQHLFRLACPIDSDANITWSSILIQSEEQVTNISHVLGWLPGHNCQCSAATNFGHSREYHESDVGLLSCRSMVSYRSVHWYHLCLHANSQSLSHADLSTMDRSDSTRIFSRTQTKSCYTKSSSSSTSSFLGSQKCYTNHIRNG